MSNKERIGIILDVDAEVSKAKGNISSLSKIFDGIGGSKGNQLRDLLSDISAEYEKLANESGKTMSKVGDFTKAEKSSERLSQLLRRLDKEIGSISKSSKGDLSKFFPPEVADRVKKASDAVKTYNTILENSSKKKGAIGAAADEYKKQEKAVKDAAAALKDLQDIENGTSKKKVVSAGEQVIAQDKLNAAKARAKELKDIYKELKEEEAKFKADRQQEALSKGTKSIFDKGTENHSKPWTDLQKKIAAVKADLDAAANEANQFNQEIKNMVVSTNLEEDIKAAKAALTEAQSAADKLKENLDNVTATEFSRAFDEAKKKLEGLSGIDLSEITNIDDLTNLLDRFTNEGVEGLVRSLSDAGVEIRELGNANDQAGAKIRDTTNDVEDQNRAMKDVSGLKTRILEFFSLTNAMQLARRGLQQTFETVKELDKAMTETAVVTDFSVGDMWDALPQYTQMANELGVATQGVYEASTLYYQQGLQTNEVMALTSETLKMARIAGLDCAEATDLMTAALRGFNMEINETNAQRINDVYSELAAITAADTEEIATAMTKTASIASSANMEFETTAALLSQIIETTREPAETAGTAMKTIIARFTEMKKATSDLVNVDGEVVSVNKVEEALQSAGVALRDVNGEFRDLDDVFLELSSKWNGLDMMTQRYIATMAAGSRQQSRFIAMMQDYDRTIELVDAAYNSSGASANQFAKTQESLESKLARLKNAWDEFLMGISNSKAIKVGVDALTNLLKAINKLTGKSGIAKLLVAIGALKGGSSLFHSLFKPFEKGGFMNKLDIFSQTGTIFDIKKIGKLKNNFSKMWTAFKIGASGAKTALAPLLPLLVALAVELAIIRAAWYFSDEQIQTRKLEEAVKLSEGLSEGLDHARNVLNQISDSQSGLQSLKDQLKQLTVGTDEWRLKLLEVQAEEAKLIEQFGLKESMPDLEDPKLQVSGLIQVDSTGSQTITDKGWEYLQTQQEDIMRTNLVASQIANAQVEKENFELEKIQILEEKEDEVAKGDNVAGGVTGGISGTVLGAAGGIWGHYLGLTGGAAVSSALSSSAIGAKIGGAIGSVAPGLGTAIGVTVGALAGAAVGYFVNEAVEEINGHGEEYQKTELQLQREQRIVDQKQYMSYKNALKQSYSENENLTAEEAEVAASINASNMDQFIATAQEEVGKKASKDEQKLWAEYKGYTWKDNKAYDKDGNEVDLSDRKTIAKELAIFKAMDAAKENAEVIAKYLKQGGEAIETLPKELGSSYEDFSKILSGDISANKETVEYMAENSKNNIEMAKKVLEEAQTEEDKISAIAAFTGKSEEDIRKEGNYEEQMANALYVKALETQLNQTYALQDFYIEAINTGIATMDEDGTIKYSAEFEEGALNKLRDELDVVTLQEITSISTSLREAFGSGGIGGKRLFEALDTMDIEAVKETVSILNEVDFSNPIRGANALQQMASSTTSSVAELGTKLQEISEEKYDIGSQFQYLMTSGVYDELSEDITKLVEENGKLTAKNIQEMAGSSEELALFLDQDGVSARGLAKAFTLVSKNGLAAMKGLTTATLTAISNTQTLVDVYEDMNEQVSTFSPAPDTMAGMDWITSSLETMEEMIDKGEYGNIQLHSYLKEVFAADIGQSQQQIYDYYNKLTQYAKNEGAGFWKMVASKGGVGDLLTFQNGISSYKLQEGTTTKQLLEQLAKDYKLTIQGAQYFLSSLTSHSIDLSNQLNTNDAKGALSTALAQRKKEQSITDKDTKKKVFMSENEVEALSLEYDIDVSKAKTILQELDDNEVVFVAEFVDKNGQPLSQTDILKELEAKGGEEGIASFMVNVKPNKEQLEQGINKIVDYTKTKELLMNLGLNEETADAAIQKFQDDNADARIDVNGELFSTAADANKWANSVFSQIDQSTLQTFVDRLANINYTAVANKLISDIDTALKNYHPIIGGILQLTSSIKGAKDVTPQVNPNYVEPEGVKKRKGIKGHAKGSSGLSRDETALTGEEGIELVQSEDGTAHLVGVNGPEIVSLKKGDVIYPADETKKILNGHSPQKLYNGYAKGTGGKTFNRYENTKDTTGKTTYPSGSTSGKITYNTENSSKSSKKDKDDIVYVDVTVNVDAKLENLERKREKGEIDAFDYETQKKGLLGFKHDQLEDLLNKQLSTNADRKYYYHDKATDSILLNENEFNKLTDKRKNEVLEEYNRVKDINDQLNEIEDEIGNMVANANTVDAINGALEAVERRYKNKDIDAIDYIKERDLLLSKKSVILQATLDEELANNVEKRFFYYDETLDAVLINEEEFNKLSEERQEEVRKEYEKVKGINDELNEIEDTLRDLEFKTPEQRQQYQHGEAVDWNTQGELDSIERNREELSRYNELIGKLPSEMQGPLSLATGGMSMIYEAQESQVLRRREAGLSEMLAAKEASSQYLDNGINDEDSSIYYYDEATKSYQLYEDKYANLKDVAQDDVMKELQEMNGYLQSLNEVQSQRSGGIFQKPFYLAEKSAKAMSKAFKNTGNTAKDVKDAFDDLEDALGLSATALDGFEGKFTDLIESSGLKEKEIKGLGLLNEKQLSAIGDSKLGGMLGDNSKNLLGMLLGEGSTNGMDFAQTGLNAFGEMMGLGGDLMSFDMMGLGLDMFNTGKGMIDQGKQMIEKIIGYITQATQVIVDAWTNREDYLYNFLQIIEKHLNEYEKLQRYQNQLEKGRTSTVEEIRANYDEQWKSLQQQLEEQQERLETRQKELERSRLNPFSLISGWNPSSDTLYENREVKFLWDLIIGLGEAFAPFGTGAFFTQFNQLYEDYDKRVQNSYEDRLAAEQALLDIEDERLELVKYGSDEATEFEQKILDAMIQKEQEQIDELTRLNDAITDANSKLISTLQDNLEKIRQERENEKKEEELSEKERRLAYLRQDTSGANMLEIKKLEEQLEEEHEDYTDTLIDQKISELEKQNEKAAEQRQQQIDLLQSQLEYAEKYGLYWDAIYGMLYTIDENGNAVLNPENFDIDGNIRENSQLAQMLGTFSDRLGMSVWSAVLDNEEMKRLGRYYGFFIGNNGVAGKWRHQWALDDPGADDPNYAYPAQEIPDGLWGVLYRLEIGIKKYFANSDSDLIDRGGRMGQAFKNFFGKLFGNEEWANYQYEAVNPSRVQSTTFAGMKKLSDDTKEWFKSLFSSNESYGNKTSRNLTGNGAQNIGDINTTNYFQIGKVGETVSLDEMVNQVAEKFRDMFSIGNNVLGRNRT